MSDEATPIRPKTFVDLVFEWFFTQEARDGESVQNRQALAWLDTPNALVSATRITYGFLPANALISAARSQVPFQQFAVWISPIEAERDLTAFLERLFMSYREQRPS